MAAKSEERGVNRIFAVLLFLTFATAGVRADLLLESVSWQRGRVEASRVVWGDADKLVDGPPKLDTRMRARLTLKNRGPIAAEGILLRYSMTGRAAPIAEAKAEGTWGIPFMVDEKRVPKIGPNKTVDIFLAISPALDLYIRRISRVGWWPDRVKLQVMIEPHAGAVALQSLESVIEVGK